MQKAHVLDGIMPKIDAAKTLTLIMHQSIGPFNHSNHRAAMMAMTTPPQQPESPRATITSSRSRSRSRSSTTLPLLLSLLLMVAAAAAAPAAAVAQEAASTPFSFLTIGDWVRAFGSSDLGSI